MVVKRKLSCGSNVFDFPSIPKAPRSSIRRKVSSSNLANGKDKSQICAIDLLASLAGKLLEESESSSTSTTYANHDHLGGGVIKQEILEDVYNDSKPCKSDFSDHVNLASKSTSSVTCLQVSSVDNDVILEQTPVFSDCKKEECGLKSLVGTEEQTCVVNEAAGFEQGEATGGFVVDGFSLKDPSQLRLQSPESVHLDGDVKLAAPCTDRVPDDSFEGYVDHSKLVCRDDDENYCKYYKFSDNCNKSSRPPSRVGNRRIKKSVMTNYGRGVSKLKCFEDTRTDGHLKALYRKRKLSYYGYNPWMRETVHRKRRLSDKGLVINCDGGLSSESVSNSPLKQESEDGVLSGEIGLHLKDSPVKFSIKSLRIPELVIEVPETATVGLLKRTVKEAVTALLGGGIRIGVVVQGKKVRDDSSTLSQTGLSFRENNLGFTLEPGPETLPVPLCSETPVVSMPTDSTDLSERSAASPALDIVIPLPLQEADLLINSGKSVENNYELVPYQSDISADEQPSSDSRTLVPVSALESGPLAIVPLNEKPKRTELSQRRTRRPFSVTEVEALVQAVEEVGTGRWRDVKLRSFENASHRTYVDLKDKWKTLVHTASISPQQRRGEPVPQELLDRVLAAHRHWSEHQMKQNGKLQVATTMVVVQSGSSM